MAHDTYPGPYTCGYNHASRVSSKQVGNVSIEITGVKPPDKEGSDWPEEKTKRIFPMWSGEITIAVRGIALTYHLDSYISEMLGCHTLSLYGLSGRIKKGDLQEIQKAFDFIAPRVEEWSGTTTPANISTTYSFRKNAKVSPGQYKFVDEVNAEVYKYIVTSWLDFKALFFFSDRICKLSESYNPLCIIGLVKYLCDVVKWPVVGSPVIGNPNYWSDRATLCQGWMALRPFAKNAIAFDTGFKANMDGTGIADMQRHFEVTEHTSGGTVRNFDKMTGNGIDIFSEYRNS